MTMPFCCAQMDFCPQSYGHPTGLPRWIPANWSGVVKMQRPPIPHILGGNNFTFLDLSRIGVAIATRQADA